jgi:hypothetical protein
MSGQPPTPDRLTDLLGEAPHEETRAYLDRFRAADAETRKRALREVRNVAEERPTVLDGLANPFQRS